MILIFDNTNFFNTNYFNTLKLLNLILTLEAVVRRCSEKAFNVAKFVRTPLFTEYFRRLLL